MIAAFTLLQVAAATLPPVSLSAPVVARQADVGTGRPSLAVQHWFRGEPVTEFESGRIYVLDFWGARLHLKLGNRTEALMLARRAHARANATLEEAARLSGESER